MHCLKCSLKKKLIIPTYVFFYIIEFLYKTFFVKRIIYLNYLKYNMLQNLSSTYV